VSCAADTFPANTHRTDALVLSLETSDDDEDFTQRPRPRRDHHLPARYRTGDFVPTSCAAARSKLLASDPAPSNVKDTNNALQQQGISTIAREGAQPQATATPTHPTILKTTLLLKVTPLPPTTMMMEERKGTKTPAATYAPPYILTLTNQ